MSHLIWMYAVCKFNMFIFGTLNVRTVMVQHRIVAGLFKTNDIIS